MNKQTNIVFSNSIVLDQAKKLVEEKRLPEDFLSTADDLDNIAQKYKDEIRNQTVRQILYSIYFLDIPPEEQNLHFF